jgi:hypothetical protein
MGRPLHFRSERSYATDLYRPLKIYRPRPCLNPRTLGPMTSTLTTRPPRATKAQGRIKGRASRAVVGALKRRWSKSEIWRQLPQVSTRDSLYNL